ncbi:MAG TPA: hypothetical protein VHQ23_08830 [Ilumatobacteraceae bacterium]|nr:hypothetical protein [Ilumatobacteraceae bacterium]
MFAHSRSAVLDDIQCPRDNATEPADAVLSFRHAQMRAAIDEFDRRCVVIAQRAFPIMARTALFVVFFWFGIIKLLGVSPATALALALTVKTVGPAHFDLLFKSLAVFECVIGVLCLIPRAVRLVVALLCIHMAVVCAPLLLVPQYTWQSVLVPTMDGQYIIKNLLVIATAVGLVAHTPSRTTSVATMRR